MTDYDFNRDSLEAFIDSSFLKNSQTRMRLGARGEYYVMAISDGYYPDGEMTKVLKSSWRNFQFPEVYIDESNPESWPWATDTTAFRGRLLGPNTPHRVPWPCKNFLVELLKPGTAVRTAALHMNELIVSSHTLFLWNSKDRKPRIGDIFRVKLTPDDSPFGFNLDVGQALEYYSSAGKSVMENWANATSTTVQAKDLKAGCKSLEDLFDYYDEELVDGDYPCIFRSPDSKHGECIEGQGSAEFEFPTVISPSYVTDEPYAITDNVRAAAKSIFKEVSAESVALLFAIRSIESARKTYTTFRFEPHLFLREHPTGDIPYLPNDLDKAYPSTDGHEHRKRETRGPGRKTSGYIPGNGSHVRVTAFSRAYAQNPTAAIKSTSWGTYQVLGMYAKNSEDEIIKKATASDKGAQAFLDLWNTGAPYFDTGVKGQKFISLQMITAWFKDKSKNKPGNVASTRALAAAKSGNEEEWLRFSILYNGSNCCKKSTAGYVYETMPEIEEIQMNEDGEAKLDILTGEQMTTTRTLEASELVDNPGGHEYDEKLQTGYNTYLQTARKQTGTTTTG